MAFRPLTRVAIEQDLLAVLPVSSTGGNIKSSDVGKLAVRSSNHGGLIVGSTQDIAHSILGIVTSVPVDVTPGSTILFYVLPLVPNALYEADFSTVASATLPATTDIGKYVGLSNTTTIAGAVLSMGTLGNAWGTTSGNFFRINRASADDISRRRVVGTFVPHYIDGVTS
jgi:hypothetical protein